jgi:hypothetical protein
MNHMGVAIAQLSSVSAFKVSSFTRTGLGPLIKILCDGKFKSFPQQATALMNKIQSGSDLLDKEWLAFSERIHKGFITTNSSNFGSVEDIFQVIKEAEELHAMTSEIPEGGLCFIKAAFVQNSKLYSSGDITIVGLGVYQSVLRAGGNIVIDGFVRGGEISGAKGVTIGEAGSKGNISTKITVPKGEAIRIRLAMEETIIQIGPRLHKFTEQSRNVFARLNDDGQLLIS